MSGLTPILALDVFTILWQTVAISIICFAAAVLLVSHLRYQRMSLDAHEEDGTGMKTDEAFRIRIAHYLGSLHREPPPFSTIVFTLEDHEALLAEFGDETVDEMMEYILSELNAVLRSSDSVLLYDRFRIGLVAAVGRDLVERFLSRLHHHSELESFRTRDGVLKKLRVRIGVATCPENGDTVHRLMDSAELALQEALADPDAKWRMADPTLVMAEPEPAEADEPEAPPAEAAEAESEKERPEVKETESSGDAQKEDPPRQDDEGAEDEDEYGGLLGLLRSKKRERAAKAKVKQEPEEEAEEDEDEADEGTGMSAMIDPLTGLLRSERMGGAMQKYVAKYRKDEEPVTLLYLDIDSLEQYNEHYGEAAGDAILKKLGEVLDQGVRQGDLLGRVGGEEFIIGMNAEPAKALLAAQRICADVKKTSVAFGGNTLRFTVCIGVAGFPQHGGVAKTLFDRALIAMRAAKYRGRSKCMMYDPRLRSSRVADPEEPVTEDAF